MNRRQRRSIKKPKQKVFTIAAPPMNKLAAPTQITLDRCYANQFLNCDGGLSREHYISESLLERFEKIPAKGIPWLAHLDGDISPASLVTRCLCEYHNSFLSPLDQFVGPAFDAFVRFGANRPEKAFVDGRYLELWMLKLLIGLLCTNKIMHKGYTFSRADIPSDWIRWLYEDQKVPNGLGLYVFHFVNERLDFSKSFTIAPAFFEKRILGIRVELSGFRFLLALEPKENAFKKDHPDYSYILYRPKGFNKDPYPQEVTFKWFDAV